MAKRTKRGQKIHDEKVNQWASRLKGPGKKVMADLPGYEKPDKVGGRIPDIMVKRGKKIVMVGEVETTASLKTDKAQQKSLKRGAKNLGADFRLKIAKEKRNK